MLKLLSTTENKKKSNQKIGVITAGKLLKKTRVKLLFAFLPEFQDASRAILFPIGNQECRKKEREKNNRLYQSDL